MDAFHPAILESNGTLTQPGQPPSTAPAPPSGTSNTVSGSSTPAGLSSKPIPRGDASTKSAGTGTHIVKAGLASMLKGGVIMDVMSRDQAILAEEAGAAAIMVLEKIPSLIRKEGGVARMSDPQLIKDIMEAVSIPIMAKVRVGHFAEAQILQAIGVDYIDESEVLTVADERNHILKHNFNAPFVCGAKDLGEALRRISEGASFIRSKGEAGTGNVVEAVKHTRAITSDIRRASVMSDEELYAFAKELQAPYHLLKETARLKRLPVVNFAAGGIATPADVALMMQLGCDGVFVGSGIFMSDNPAKTAKAIVQAATHFNNPKILADISCNLGKAMPGLTISDTMIGGRFAGKGA